MLRMCALSPLAPLSPCLQFDESINLFLKSSTMNDTSAISNSASSNGLISVQNSSDHAVKVKYCKANVRIQMS